MTTNNKNTSVWDHTKAMAVTVFLIFVFHLLRQVNEEIWESIYYVYYMWTGAILIAFYFYYRRFQGAVELKLLIAYWGWFCITRIINGDYFLTVQWDLVLDLGIGCVMLALAATMDAASREKFIKAIFIVTTIYYSFLAFVSVYAVLMQRELFNPFTGTQLAAIANKNRLTLFELNPNYTGFWFFMTIFMLVYLFGKSRSLLVRILIIPVIILNYLALAMSYSRNCMLAFSFCLALLAAMFLLKRLKDAKNVLRIAASMALVVLVTITAYKSFSITNKVTAELSMFAISFAEKIEDVPSAEARPETADSAEGSVETSTPIKQSTVNFEDNRGFNDSGRIEIYKTIDDTFREEPLRLIRGCSDGAVMSVANQHLSKLKAHYHNSYLQVSVLTGIPGLLCVLAFSILLGIKILRSFFSDMAISEKILSLPLIGSFMYCMLETSLFVEADTRTYTFYILAGAFLAYYNEHKTAVKI